MCNAIYELMNKCEIVHGILLLKFFSRSSEYLGFLWNCNVSVTFFYVGSK